jgi:hypothetical protein
MSKAKFNPELFAFAVTGLLHASLGISRDQIRRDASSRRSVMTVEGPIIQPFDFEGKMGEGLTREAVEKLQKQWEGDRYAARLQYDTVVETVRKWLDDYEIIFSQSTVHYGPVRPDWGDQFYVRVGYKLD